MLTSNTEIIKDRGMDLKKLKAISLFSAASLFISLAQITSTPAFSKPTSIPPAAENSEIAFVLENVKALAKLEKWSEVRKRIFSVSQEMGYTCFPFLLNATEYGVPQKRERVFFIGIKNDLFFEEQINYYLQNNKIKAKTIKETLFDLGRAGSEKNPNTCTAKITFATNPIMRKTAYSGMYFNGQGRPINIDDYANTLPASMGGNKTPFIDEEYLYGDVHSNWVESYHKKLVDGYEPVFE